MNKKIAEFFISGEYAKLLAFCQENGGLTTAAYDGNSKYARFSVDGDSVRFWWDKEGALIEVKIE